MTAFHLFSAADLSEQPGPPLSSRDKRQKIMKNNNISVRIIGNNNGVGLTKDAEIIISLVENMGMSTRFESPLKHKKRNMTYIKYKFLKFYRKVLWPILSFFFRGSKQDINIFLEHIDPYFLSQGKINCFMPNPEYCKESDLKLLPKMNYVLCKTRITEKVFSSLSPPTYFTGFTTQDSLDPKVTLKSETFFHLAGKSIQKGTKPLIDLWAKHPDWPHLTIVMNPKIHKETTSYNAENISYIFKYLDPICLQKLQNENLFHLCPSEAEGFGHYIVEALSCGAITLTTDAPPMNEIVTKDRGILVKYKSKSPQMKGVNYYIDHFELEKQITKMMHMCSKEKKSISKEARDWFVKNDRDFKIRFKNFLHTITELPH